MTDVDVAGYGVWSPRFTSPDEFVAVLQGQGIESAGALKPERIPARERRRAPAAVKMAVEVMDQACAMAGIDPAEVASVFGSGMSDMDITDYMCRTLADSPRAVSPTKFHNSVHNASTGYWSIATHSHSPANAICGYANTVAVSILEAAVQASEEQTPVLVAVEEIASPQPFRSIVEIDEPFAAAMLFAPAGQLASPPGSLHLELGPGDAETTVAGLPEFHGNFAAAIMPLLAALAEGTSASASFPLAGRMALHATLDAGEDALEAHG